LTTIALLSSVTAFTTERKVTLLSIPWSEGKKHCAVETCVCCSLADWNSARVWTFCSPPYKTCFQDIRIYTWILLAKMRLNPVNHSRCSSLRALQELSGQRGSHSMAALMTSWFTITSTLATFLSRHRVSNRSE